IVTMDQFNQTNDTNRLGTAYAGGTIRQLNLSGTEATFSDTVDSANKGTVAFSIGNVRNNANSSDVLLVTTHGTTWTRRVYACSFGSDYAEVFRVADCSPTPKAGDLICIDDAGEARLYDPLTCTEDDIIGIVSTTPTIVGEGRSLLTHERDPDTLELIPDGKISTVPDCREVTVGLIGRILLREKWLKYVPKRWRVLKDALETKRYDGFVYVLVR